MAARRPTRSLLQKTRVINVSNENVPGYFLLLEMAFYTQGRIAFIQQTLVDGPVRRMANGATLAQCLMLVDKRAALLCVTLEARFVFAQERKAAGLEFLLNICGRAFNRDSLVRVVTVGAAHFAFEHRMMMRQCEGRAYFQMTLETRLRRFSRIYDRAGAATGFDVQTPGPVAGFAAHVRNLLPSLAALFAALSAALTYDNLLGLQSRMGGRPEIAHDLFVTGRAFL